MALMALEKWPPGWKLSGDWLVVLITDLASIEEKASGRAI